MVTIQLQKKIKKSLSLDEETGRIFWIDPPKHHSEKTRTEAGTIYGRRNGDLRRRIVVDRKSIAASHIAYFLHHGIWPNKVIDHINGNPLDNRPVNLRDVDIETNNRNHRKVSIRKMPSGRYQARLSQKVIGTFDTKEEAEVAYKTKREELWKV
ncbi:MAG: HNH endonuclease [Bacteroidota bacterium]|nr:HNH endonuclease [Bacteroidota bacterium]